MMPPGGDMVKAYTAGLMMKQAKKKKKAGRSKGPVRRKGKKGGKC